MTPALALNYGLRGAAVALLLLVSAQLWRDAKRTIAGRLGAVFALSAAAYALYFAPGLALPSALWHLPLAMLAQGAAVLFWLLMGALFEDDFQLRGWHGLVWLGVGVVGFWQFFVLIPTASPYRGIVGAVLDVQPVLFALLGLWRVVSNWKTDLIDLRRHFRGVVLVATLLNIGLVAVTKWVTAQHGQGVVVSSVEAVAVCLAAFWVAWQLQRQGMGDWGMSVPSVQGVPPEPPAACVDLATEPHADPSPASPGINPALLAALDAKMMQEGMYRDEGLSIGSLAQSMGVQEYQLRRLINQGLGFRNFNAYVNHYRLQDATAALADPDRRDVSVLNIAMDSGFASLGPFNRAFKAHTGMTPTEFRKSRLKGS